MKKKVHNNIKHHVIKGYNFLKKIRKKRNNINILLTTLAIVMIRRWAWWLLDKYLFPNNEILSLIISVVIWIIILFIDDEMLDELDWWHR